MNSFPLEIKKFIEEVPWTFAKTYAKTWPHEYIIKKKVDEKKFYKLAEHLRVFGYLAPFYSQKYHYFDFRVAIKIALRAMRILNKIEIIFIMNNIAHFNQDFLRLREDYTSLKKEFAIKDKKEASRYNIFSILNIHEFEVKTHTPFLKNLLEVDGTHGQGDLFLSSFIQKFIPHEKKQYFILDKEDDYRVEEEFFTGQNSRLDIYIHSHDPQKKFCMLINFMNFRK